MPIFDRSKPDPKKMPLSEAIGFGQAARPTPPNVPTLPRELAPESVAAPDPAAVGRGPIIKTGEPTTPAEPSPKPRESVGSGPIIKPKPPKPAPEPEPEPEPVPVGELA